MYEFRNLSPIHPINTMDKDVQSMLLPLNIIFPKYHVKDNIPTPNSVLTNFVLMIITLVFVFSLKAFTFTMIKAYW